MGAESGFRKRLRGSKEAGSAASWRQRSVLVRPSGVFQTVSEGGFCELRMYGVLRSSPRKFQELVHLGDTLHLEEGYASGRNQKAKVVRHFYPSRKEKGRCSGSQPRRLCG